MECISELKDSLNAYFGWNKARMSCFVNMLLALLTTRTVNLAKLSCAVFGEAQQASRYRRLQRFFSQFPLDDQQIAGFIFKLFLVDGGKWYLSMDRTNWRWGKSDINILMLGVVFKGTAIPIYWTLLDKRGNSDTAERITLLQLFIKHFGKSCIKGVLADREFVGKAMEEKQYFVYILASKKYGTLYTGITSNLVQRLYQHKEGLAEGFTKKYNIQHLVYYEIHSDVLEAITREKRIKKHVPT